MILVDKGCGYDAVPGISMVEKDWFRQWGCSGGVVLNPECIEQAGSPIGQNGT